MSALTIYECPKHGAIASGFVCSEPTAERGWCGLDGVEVRVFREEDVRPLWESADGDHDRDLIHDAADAFPAPDDWKQNDERPGP